MAGPTNPVPREFRQHKRRFSRGPKVRGCPVAAGSNTLRIPDLPARAVKRIIPADSARAHIILPAMSPSFLNTLFWIAVVLAVAGQIAILYSTFVAVPAARRAGTAPDIKTSRSERMLEALWAWLPVGMLALVLALTWSAVRSSQGVTWRLVVPEAGAEPVVLPSSSAALVPAGERVSSRLATAAPGHDRTVESTRAAGGEGEAPASAMVAERKGVSDR